MMSLYETNHYTLSLNSSAIPTTAMDCLFVVCVCLRVCILVELKVFHFQDFIVFYVEVVCKTV
eukprot:m.96422 g.96422  ORF g.96422 m.96422 type:complete len:63 (+) comp12464_c0_seq2:305-493(+)